MRNTDCDIICIVVSNPRFVLIILAYTDLLLPEVERAVEEENEEAGARAEVEGVVRLVLCGGEGPSGLVLTTLHSRTLANTQPQQY